MKKKQQPGIQALSQKEVEVIAWLEFEEKYFFTIQDIGHFFKNTKQRYNFIQRLMKKKRIVKLNKQKYYLVPIKAKSGLWVESSSIIADELCNGKNYFIGGWSAANYWRLTDQIPMRTDIYTTRRQGRVHILTSDFVFHRTTKKRLQHAIPQKIKGHLFYILNKKETQKWLKSKN